MADIKLGKNIYSGVQKVKLDTTDGGSTIYIEYGDIVSHLFPVVCTIKHPAIMPVRTFAWSDIGAIRINEPSIILVDTYERVEL